MKPEHTSGSGQVRPTHPFVEFKKEDVEQSIPERFEKIVQLYPDRIAIKTSEQTLTYAELNTTANRIARAILAWRGDKPEPIGLFLEQGTALMASMLGALKAGKFFVLLDPSFPTARNAARVEDSQAELIVTDRENTGSAGELATGGRRIMEFSSIDDDITPDDFRLPLWPHSLAYLTYTSGSTGQPKGVAQNHRNILHDTMLLTNAYHISREDRCSLLASSTSVAVKNACFALLNGASLLTFDVKKEGVLRLGSWLSQERISICRCDVQLFRQLCEALTGKEFFQDLRLIEFVGDTRFTSDVELWKKYFPPTCLLSNGFASSETGYVTDYLMDYETDVECKEIPAGHPLEDKEIILLDEIGNAVGCNQVGEISVRSSYLSPGYWRRPELTEAMFRPDQKGGDQRIFLTGDLGLLFPDGCLVYRGRKDFRVKVRGYTVEIAEIESALLKHPRVKGAGVVAWDRDGGDKYLVAYVVPRQPPAPMIDELRSFLNAKLPDYMLPSAFMFLDALPLTHGKLDRKALPQPENQRPELGQPYVSPQSGVEQKLVEIWEEVLDIRPIGIHDNFFDLGGHSLVATRIATRVNDVFQVDLPPNELFENPTIAAQADYIEKARRRRQKSAHRFIPIVSRHGRLPLSFAQERLWFLHQLDPESAAYNEPSAVRLSGYLDVDALEKALNQIVARHEVLRTTIVAADGTPLQVIANSRTVDLSLIDLRLMKEKDCDVEANRLIGETIRRPFNLTRDVMLRVLLLRLADQEHTLLIVKHHIASDVWSSRILWQELTAFYRTFTAGHPSPLRELPVQYVDYAAWQRNWLKGEVLETQLSYWKKQLDNIPTLQLPTDRPRPTVQSFRGAKQSFTLPKDLSVALKALSRQESATLFMTLLAAFQLLLSRYSGQDDIVVGAPIAGRNRTEIEGLIGCFLNNLVLRTDLSGNPSFRELLGRVRRVALGAYTHQDLPFEKLLEELRPERDLSRTPLFQVYFNMNDAEGRLELPGLTAEPMSLFEPLSKFDFTLYVREQAGKIRFNLVYNVDIFERDRMVELLGQLDHLLSQIAENPDRRIKSFSLVTPAAEGCLPNPARRLDDVWKGAVHTQFARQAEKFPERPAVVDRWGSWSYGETDARSNRIAHCLLASGIGPRDVVAIYSHRSAPLVWAVLGVLKAGAAFMILDPADPAARLVECLQAAKPRGWLQIAAAGPLPDALEKFISASSIRCRLELSAGRAAASRDPLIAYSTDDPGIAVGPDDLAYVAFTSGSTGRPKGVLGRHGPLSHFLPWQEAAFHLGASDRFSMLSGLSHDPLQRDIFTPLWLGATISIPDPEIIGTPKLARWMAEERITFAHLTPAMAELLTETAAPDCRVTSLRYAFFLGDKLRRRDVARLRRLAPEAVCIASYGTTETQRTVGYYVIRSPAELQETREKEVYPLGRGVEDAQLLVLTAERQLAGVGELGEIHLRSPHLAQGYLGDEELTRARFLTNPFTGVDGDRLYRTGDMGRFLPDGAVEFVGRMDDQVKIRGFRVEPGEIEKALAEIPSVRQAFVTAQEEVFNRKSKIENLKSGKRLVAYVVSSQNPAPPSRELRDFLKQKLPRFMIPSLFVFVESFPLTPNGKVDRRALPDPGQSAPDHRNYVAPSGIIDQELARIWEELLSVRPIGVDDDFFDLGGHSLLAVQMVHRIEQACGQRLPLTTLLAGPTIKYLAEALRIQRVEEDRSLLVKVQPGGSKTPIFFLHEDFRRGGFYCLTLARCLGPDQPFYALAPHGLNGSSVPDTVEAMAASYIQIICEVQPHGPYLLGGYCNGGTVALEMAQQLRRRGEQVTLVVLVAAAARNALAKRFARRFTDGLGALLGLGPEKRLRMFLGLRAGVRPVRRLVRRARGLYRKHRSPTDDLFLRALSTYIARPYSGRVALFWPSESGSSAEVSRNWRPLVPHIEVQTVPGGHVSCVAVHAEVLGDRMMTCLEAAQEKISNGSVESGRSDLF